MARAEVSKGIGGKPVQESIKQEDAKIMALTQTEVLGFNTKVIAAMNQNKQACADKGLDVTAWIEEQTALAKTAGEEDATQERMKRELRTQTDKTTAAFDAVYDNGSSRLDAMAGAVGKTTDLGKSLLALRSSVRSGTHAAPAGGSSGPQKS